MVPRALARSLETPVSNIAIPWDSDAIPFPLSHPFLPLPFYRTYVRRGTTGEVQSLQAREGQPGEDQQSLMSIPM